VVIHAVGDVMLGRRFYGLQTAEHTHLHLGSE
jgi:hypothetical protein